MNTIIPPLRLGDAGPQVANLHVALSALSFSITDAEVEGRKFGSSTQRAVRAFQEREHLPLTGAVDAMTAARLNELLAGTDDVPPGNHVFVPGRITSDANGAPLAAAKVTATLIGALQSRSLATLVTDPQGVFKLVYDPATFPDWAGEGAAISLRVLRNGEVLPIVEGPRKWAVGQAPDRADLVVELSPVQPDDDDDMSERQIEGTVRHTDGTALGGVKVQLVGLTLMGEEGLQTQAAASDGTFEFVAIPDTSTCLFVRVLGEDGRVVASSPPVEGGGSVRVDVYVRDDQYRGPSDFARIDQVVAPLVEGRDLGELNARSVGFIVRKTGLHRKQVTPYLLARRQAAASWVDAEPSLPRHLYAESLYGLLRTGGTRAIGRLLNAPKPSIVNRLRSAGAANIVSPVAAASGAAVHVQLQASLAREAAHGNAPRALGSLLLTTASSDAQRRTLVARHFASAGAAPSAFWRELREDSTFGDTLVDDVQFSLHLGVLTGNHTPLVSALRRDARLRRARDVASFTENDWLEHIRSGPAGSSVGVPPSIPGKNPAEREEAYARRLVKDAERAFPTAFVAARMGGAEFSGKELLLPFLDGNIEFDLGRTSIHTWRGSDGAALSGDLRKVLARHQRLFRIAPSSNRWASMHALDTAGIGSARDVVRTGKRAFVRRFASAAGGEAQARAMYDTALAQTAQAMNLLTNLGATYQGPVVQSLPSVSDAMAEIEDEGGLPEWRTLFGSIDFCACEHCRSILSPAAYFTDLLEWLDEALPNGEALAPLRKRRPDLFALELSCANTNTFVPYVDLVVECLENRVADARPQLLDNMDHTASTLPSDVLLAYPEYLNQAVYVEVLAKAFFPFELPFDLAATQARVYLEQQGVLRPDLMEAFRRGDTPSDVDIASERLGLTPFERQLVTGQAGESQQKLWGYPEATGGSPTSLETLARAPEFLDRSGLSFPELLDLLHVSWVNPEWTFGLVSPEGESHCDLAVMQLENGAGSLPGADFYDRARRFLRLWRKVGGSIIDLDKALIALGASELDDAVIESLSHIRRIRKAVRIDLAPLLSLWSNLDLKLDRPGREVPIVPLYDRVFLDRAVMADEEDWPFALDESRALKDPNVLLSDRTVQLQAALGVTAEELDELLERLDPDARITIATLSQLYRSVALARAMKLPVASLLDYRGLFAQLTESFDPFVGDDGSIDTAATLRFIEEVRAIEAAGFSASDLLYLLGHDADAALAVGPDETIQATFLTELRAGLLSVEAETVVEPDPTGELTEQLLSELVDAADLDAVMALIDGSAPVDPAEAERLYTTYLSLFLTGPRPDHWSTLPAAERYGLVLLDLVPYLSTVRKERLVQQKMASFLGLDPNQSEALMALTPASVLGEVTAEGAAELLGVLLSNGFMQAEALETASDHPAAFATLTLLDKIAKLFSLLEVGIDEQTWLLSAGISDGMLDPAALPLASTVEAAALYPRWRTLREALRLRDVLPGSAPLVIELLTLASAPGTPRRDLLAQLSDRTGWSFDATPDVYSDLRWLSDELGFRDAAAFRDGTALHALAACFAVLGKVGVTAQQAAAWGVAEVTPPVANAITLAAKADYESTRWYEVARPLRNELREGQRAALVAWLVHDSPHLSSSDELFADVLLDVEMDPCLLTSRIVQAISSVQLYVQRCFLNLEAPELGPDAEERWDWMRNYRVWEANRRVFLYPENWLRSELRDDKSELFEALETQLLQAPITDATAEQAYLSYLQGLLQISRLEIVAYYHEEEEDGESSIDVLHVFGRTPNLPRVYFYRRRDTGVWSPWQKAELDIEGDHLIPVIHNRRLMVFWPIFLEQGVADTDSGGAPPAKFFTIQLAHSELRDGAWTPKQVSEQELTAQAAGARTQPASIKQYFHFRPTRAVNGSLEIESLYSYDSALPSKLSLGKFVFDDATGAVRAQSEPVSDAPFVYPTRTTASYSRLSLERWPWYDSDSPGAWFSVGVVDENKNLITAESAESVLVLRTPAANTFYTYARQYDEGVSQGPSFYFDDERAFLVEPKQGWSPRDYSEQFNDDMILMEASGQADMGSLHQAFEADDSFEEAGAVMLFDHLTDALPASHGGSALNRRVAVKVATASASVTNLGEMQAAETFGISIGPSASQAVVAWDPFAQTAAGVQQAAAYADAHAYNAAAVYQESATLHAYTQADPGTLGEPFWTYSFKIHFHPFATRFIREVRRYGVDGLLAPADEHDGTAYHTLARQKLARFAAFEEAYDPVESVVEEPYPVENIEFGESGAYSLYNWELFFHIPLMIAGRLRREGRFEEALRWFRFIFDPTNSNPAYSPPYRYWKVKPFTTEVAQTIPALLGALGSDDPSPEAVAMRADVEAQIAAYARDPFNPWAIARLRITAFQKAVVIQYVQMILEWGDSLFRRDTMESINEATQLYVMAGAILGDRPEQIPAREEVISKSWDELALEGLDAFSNALVEVENLLFTPRPVSGAEPPSLGATLYFCVPHNESMLALWNTVDDRLYKIRHCMNIEGVVRHLPLFQPRIDPGMLVSAAAGGGSLASAVAGLSVALPHYRFRVMVQKAQALAGNVRALGSALLSALEKKDAEALQQLRMGHEVALLDAARDVRKQQVEEAQAALQALEKSKAAAQKRATHYTTLVEEGLSELEDQQITMLKTGNTFAVLSQAGRALSAGLFMVPNFDAGAEGLSSPVLKAIFGGANLGQSAASAADVLGTLSTFYSQRAAMHGLNASNARREQEWQLQADLAEKDVESISKQIEAAVIRQQITERELKNHDLQREQARTVDQWMQSKYTSTQLYDWLITQLSAVHYQCYALAHDMARQAERCYQHELARYDASFVQLANWDSLNKGLLAGEKLELDLARMEVSYLQNDKRALELTQNVSLARIDPIALVALRETGACTFQLQELHFDLDVPGLYLRRIKSVGVTVPAVVGPLLGLHLKLTLLQSSTRLTPAVSDPADPGASYPRQAEGEARFLDELGATESIVTSTGRNDSGLFQLSHDDPRYLPFEGRGVISTWQLSLEGAFETFDRRTIPDVVLHVMYTARDGGDVLKRGAIGSIYTTLGSQATGLAGAPGPLALFSARRDFPNAFHEFLHPAVVGSAQSLALSLDLSRFPYALRRQDIAIDRLLVFLLPAPGVVWSDDAPLVLTLVPQAGADEGLALKMADSLAEGVPMAVFDYGSAAQPTGTFTWSASPEAIARVGAAFQVDGQLNAAAIEDVLIIAHYAVTGVQA